MSGIPAHYGGDIGPLLRAAFQHASLGIAFYDRDLRFIAVNRAFAAISGVSARAMKGGGSMKSCRNTRRKSPRAFGPSSAPDVH